MLRPFPRLNLNSCDPFLYLFLDNHDGRRGNNGLSTLDQCDLVRHAENWHEDSPTRPEDVIIASFVMLRRLAVSLRFSFPKGHQHHGLMRRSFR